IPVVCNKNVEIDLCQCEQFSISLSCPTSFGNGLNRMILQFMLESPRQALIQKHLHFFNAMSKE
ncbi:MAG: hypothetical protein QUS14_17500, partial [Pyrinomonadaceae bacterium]|nr:hypothetical protein [Pyrinomonadaceae bacterium]